VRCPAFMENDLIASWLFEDAAYLPDFRSVLDGLIERLRAGWLPLVRISFGVGMHHYEMLAAIYAWELGDLTVDRSGVPHGVETTEMYLNSPFRLLEIGPPVVLRRLAGPEAEIDYPILQGIRDSGAADYLAMALQRSDGDANRCSFSIDQPEGFSEDELAILAALRPYIGVITELQSRARMTRSLLNLYLGPEAGAWVYSGQIKRGEGMAIRSVLWTSDLRGFAHLSEDEPLEWLTVALNDYFTAMIEPVNAEGGEVLKLIGDGVLRVFRIEHDFYVGGTCEAALNAAERALANMALPNKHRGGEGKPVLDAGIALHVGEAMYGNVGAQDRLDFAVIGPAVNLCAGLQALAGERREPITCSAE